MIMISALVVGGCHHHTVITGDVGASKHEVWKHGAVYGLVPTTTDAAAICKERAVTKVQTRQMAVQWFIAALTFGLYTPWQVTVTCGDVIAGAR